MSILKKTVVSLSQKEVINYKLYANRIKYDKERKDIKLFDLLKSQKKNDSNESTFFDKLYPKKSPRNGYARLRNRLLTEVNNSLIQFYFHETDSHYIYNELGLYKIYVAKNEWEVALYHLAKAEQRAKKIQDNVMLFVVYNEFINLSFQYDEINPSVYIKKREETTKKLNASKALDDLLTNITYQLKRTQNFSKQQSNIVDTLKKTIKRLNTKNEIKDDLLFESKLFNAISLLLLSKKDYVSLEDYTISTYKTFLKKHYFSKNNHNLKLQMLSYICNTLCANKKHVEALDYLKELNLNMKAFDNLLFNNYVFFYHNALANNYAIINPQKAVETLHEACQIKSIVTHPRHLGYIYLSLAGVYFDLKKYRTALQNIVKLYNHKVYKMLDDSFKLNIAIIEIILQIDLKKLDYATELLNSTMAKHKSILTTEEYKQDFDFLMLATQLLEKHHFEKNENTAILTDSFCSNHYKNPSNSIINYNQWLTEKIS